MWKRETYLSFARPSFFALVAALLLGIGTSPIFAAHPGPIIIKGQQVPSASRYPLSSYALFRSGPSGEAVAVPFQIDEMNDLADFILGEGAEPNSATSNGIFDGADELVFMGHDFGPTARPKTWPNNSPPDVLLEITATLPATSEHRSEVGAVYLGVYTGTIKPPPASPDRYVSFDLKNGEVLTSRYRYQFDQKNHLVVRGIGVRDPRPQGQGAPGEEPLVFSSTVFLHLDFKYFFTKQLYHGDLQSVLEAYKTGPVRTIVRVGFLFQLLKLKLSLGMYTEISFFANAVHLPAIMSMPINGKSVLNSGSMFYYGLLLKDVPQSWTVSTDLPAVTNYSSLADLWQKALTLTKRPQETYFFSAHDSRRLVWVEFTPSVAMRRRNAIPNLFLSNESVSVLQQRNNNQPNSLETAPINLGWVFDMTRFDEGEHIIDFRLFFENRYTPELDRSFRELKTWVFSAQRLLN